MSECANAPVGTACSENGGVVCDGEGNCTQTYTVLRVGDGKAALANETAAVFLETYVPVANSAAISKVTVPAAPSPTNTHPLTILGSAISEGALSRSTDGHHLTLAGYGVATGQTSVGAVRVVGLVSAAGVVDTDTTLAATTFGGATGNIRSATTVDGSAFWVGGASGGAVAGAGGAFYVTHGAAAGTAILSNPPDVRTIDIFGGQLYATSGEAGDTTVLSIGSGLPTTAGQTATTLAGLTKAVHSPYGFVFLDNDATLYIADDGAGGNGTGGLSRWTLVAGSWVEDTTFKALKTPCRGVTGWSTGSGDVLVVTSGAGITSGASSITLVDVPTGGTATAKTIETAATNTAFRGIALAAH